MIDLARHIFWYQPPLIQTEGLQALQELKISELRLLFGSKLPELILPKGVKLPEDATLFSLLTSVRRMLQIPRNYFAPFKSVPMSDEEVNLLSESISARWIQTGSVEEIQDLCFSKIKNAYCYKYALKNFYKKNPSLDKKEFQDLSAQLKILSKEALIECIFDRVASKNIKMMIKTYLEFNLKEEWECERWWHDKFSISTFVETAINKIPSEKRDQFQKVRQALVELYHHISEILKELPNPEKMRFDVYEVNERAIEKAQKIYIEANNAYIESPEMCDAHNLLAAYMRPTEKILECANPKDIKFMKEEYNNFCFV